MILFNFLDSLSVFTQKSNSLFTVGCCLKEDREAAAEQKQANRKLKTKRRVENERRPGTSVVVVTSRQQACLLTKLCTQTPYGLLMSGLHINYKTMHAELSYSCCWKAVRIQHHYKENGGKKQREVVIWNENNRTWWVTQRMSMLQQGKASLAKMRWGFIAVIKTKKTVFYYFLSDKNLFPQHLQPLSVWLMGCFVDTIGS